MTLTLLQVIIFLSWLIFVIFAFDSFQRKSFNSLHFLVFWWGTALLLYFVFFPNSLNKFGSFFWLARWADLIVYVSIIGLVYLYFELLNKTTKHAIMTTRLITEQAIQRALSHNELSKLTLKENKLSDYIFLVRSFNEWITLPNVIDNIIKKWFSKILVVNDWSSDDTVKLILWKKEQYKESDIILLSHLINRWWWAANKTWFEFLRRYSELLQIKWVVTFDADEQMNIDDMDIFTDAISKNINKEIFLGSRFIEWWSASEIPKLRKIILFWSRIITRFFNGISVSDPHNWYRVLSINALKQINVESDWMTYASELLEQIHNLRIPFMEVPVNIKYTEYSLAKGQKNSNALKILKELVYKKFFYK